jgi:hypothetical protein
MFVADYNPEIKVIKPFKFVDFIIGITKYKQRSRHLQMTLICSVNNYITCEADRVVGDVLTLVLSTKESTWHLIHARKFTPLLFRICQNI